MSVLITRLGAPLCRAITVWAVLLMLFPAAVAALAAVPNTIVIDDFENGVGAWTRNDKVKTDDPNAGVLLVDVVATKPGPGGLAGSHGAGLFAFKAATNSWAAASIRVDGARWAAIGAQRLTFWLNAGGETEGVEVVLRGQYRGADGTNRDEVFALPRRIDLDRKQWRKVVIPLSDFRSPQGPVLARISGVYLLQFLQRGTWDSRFFDVDQLQVEGNGTPLPQAGAVAGTDGSTSTGTTSSGQGTPPNPTAGTADGTAISVDFLRTQGRIRASANVSVGANSPDATAGVDSPLVASTQFRRALHTLMPRFVRLDAGSLADLIDSSRPGFEFGRLQAAVRQVRALGFEPLVALPNPSAWGLDAPGYAAFAAQAAGAVQLAGLPPVRYFELATAPGAPDDATAVALYNRAWTVLKGLSRTYRVGGITASSGRSGTQAALLRGATGLDFLSVQYFGAAGAQPAPAVLFESARNVRSLRLTAAALDASRWKSAAIYVTQSNLNASRGEGEEPADGRLVQMISAAWWVSFMGSASRVADQVFHNDAANPAWGMLDESSRAYPAYYASWLWNSFFANGGVRVEARVTGDAITAVAANTATAHNLLIANTTGQDQTARISIRGFPVLRAARIRVLEDPQKGVRFEDLPKSPFQTVTLRPYSVAVLQFTEPPR